jgi:hypothetical protein
MFSANRFISSKLVVPFFYRADKRLILSYHVTSKNWLLQGGTVGGCSSRLLDHPALAFLH